MPWFYALGHWVLLEPKQNRHLIHQISKMRILVFLYIAYFMSEMIYQNKYNSDMKKKTQTKKTYTTNLLDFSKDIANKTKHD